MPYNGRKGLRFLVIGCGSIGSRHIGNLHALNAGEILAFDVQAERLGALQSKVCVEAVSDFDDAFKRGPDVVLIAAPSSLHIPLALQAAKQGCHLFIEKPLSNSLEGVDQLLDAVRKQNLVTLVGCNMRFHPGLMKVKQLLEEGTIGRIVTARVEVGQYLPDWHPWEDYRQGYSAKENLGGGVILDAIHEIDYIRWMLGKVEAVACFAGKLSRLEIDTEDTAEILLRFTSGAIGEVHMDYVQRAYSRTCHLIGDEGTIRWDYVNGEVRVYSAATQEWQVLINPDGWVPNQMYVDELTHFLKCLAGEEDPALDVFEAKQVLEVTLAAKASAETRQIINLPG